MGICLILGGQDPCPDGLGHFFRDEVPQSARLSAGRGVQKLFGQCPNACCMNCNGASLSAPNQRVLTHLLKREMPKLVFMEVLPLANPIFLSVFKLLIIT